MSRRRSKQDKALKSWEINDAFAIWLRTNTLKSISAFRCVSRSVRSLLWKRQLGLQFAKVMKVVLSCSMLEARQPQREFLHIKFLSRKRARQQTFLSLRNATESFFSSQVMIHNGFAISWNHRLGRQRHNRRIVSVIMSNMFSALCRDIQLETDWRCVVPKRFRVIAQAFSVNIFAPIKHCLFNIKTSLI